jgi:hypothetical protein
MKEALGMGCLTLKKFTAEGLKGGLLYWGPWIIKGRLSGQESFLLEAQLGNLKWL